METDDALSLACSQLPGATARFAETIGSATDLSIPARNSDWSLRHVTLHVATTARCFIEMADPDRPVKGGGLAGLHHDIEHRIADITEEDPVKLGALLEDAVEEFVEACVQRPGTHPVDFTGCPITLAALAGLMVGEVVLHGYDLAFALGWPWPIDPIDANLSLGGFAPVLGLIVDPEQARGHSAGYGIELRGGPAMTVRFTDGVYGLEAAGAAPVDVTISADPVAFLLVASGRLSRYEAIALGLLSAGGRRPELALGFPDLFYNP
jgi:mycothiol maleylpyruvate isomerase-like protein